MDIVDKQTLQQLAPKIVGDINPSRVSGKVEFGIQFDTREIGDNDPVRKTVQFLDEMHLKGGSIADRKVGIVIENLNGNVTLASDKHGDQLLLPCLSKEDRDQVLQVVEGYNLGLHD